MAETNTSEVIFLICGDGPFAAQLACAREWVVEFASFPCQSHDRLNDLLNIADIHLLPQTGEVTDSVCLSKLLGMLASGRPVVATVRPNSEVGRLVEGCGVLSHPAIPRGSSMRS